MSAKTKNIWTILLFIAAANFCLISAPTVRAQDEDASRRLWDGAFLKKRSEAKTSAPARKTTAYRRTTPKKTAEPNQASQGLTPNKHAPQNQTAEQAEGEMIGLTIWRLRPSRAADNREARLLLEEGSSKEVEWTPERVEADTIFAPGERVRLGIESPRDGYLYVIDREQYTDGGLSDPYLIYPSLLNRDGANLVSAGKLIELPERAAFQLKPLRPDYAGEVLTILVTTEPLKNLKPGSGPVKLDSEMVAKWESQWVGAAERFELVGGAGKPYTKAEKEAGQDGARALTQDDAMPQTLYHVDVKHGAPLLVKVPLRIGK
ncbi:MAG TPA: DUF4384 domain-containing protein [Blastocatellia bacterium]|nr:DUF4384 domain-containing protein [Blastocatellia bacterium]